MNILEALQAQSGETGETFIDVNPNGPTEIPGGDDLLLSEFARLGTDLQITLPSGEEVVVVDYFAGGGAAPEIQTEGGAVMNGSLVTQLAGPMVPDTQVAQSGTSDALGEAAGTIDTMTGIVTATRGGVEVELNAGDPIYEGDVLNTAEGSAVGIVFADDSTMSMGGNARISIDEMVYDAEAGEGSQLFDIVQGAFVFASGQIGHNDPENVQVRTPVATIGIRGTKYAVDVDQELGDATVTLFEGAVVVENSGGQVLLNSIGQSTRIGSSFVRPGDVFVMDRDTQTETYGDAIDYHPNSPQLREDDDGGGRDGPVNGDDLSAAELEELAEQLDDLDTAAGPSGAIAGFTQSALFLRLLNQVLEGTDVITGELADDELGFGDALELFELQLDNGLIATDPLFTPIDTGTFRTFDSSDFGDDGGTVTFTFGDATDVSVSGGSSSQDIFSIDVTSYQDEGGNAIATDWTIGQDGTEVTISEDSGTNINMTGVEELSINLGGASDEITVNDLSNTEIAESTVFIDGGAGDDIIDAAEANKRLVAEGGEGDDTITGGRSNDNLFGEDGADTLIGGTGNDLLEGGAGDDKLTVTASGTQVNQIDGLDDEVQKLEDLITARETELLEELQEDGEGESEYDFSDDPEIQRLQGKIDDLERKIDIVDGGEGNDTLILKLSDDMISQDGVVEDILALKTFVDNGGAGPQTFDALGIEVTSIESIQFENIPDLKLAPTLSLEGDAVEDEEISIKMDFGAEGIELMSIAATITGLPEGATLTTVNGVEILIDGIDALTLSGDALGDFTVQLPENSKETFELTVSATATSLLDGSVGEAFESDATSFEVSGAADGAEVSVESATGSEDSVIPLTIEATPIDNSEVLTISIGNIPDYATLVDGDGNPITDPTNLSVADLEGLALAVTNDFSGDISLEVSVTSTDGESKSEPQVSTLTVAVEGVADAPYIDVNFSDGYEDLEIPIYLNVSLTDSSEEIVEISVSGMPEGAELRDRDGNTVDENNISVEDLDGLVLIPPQDFSGDIPLTVTATSRDGDDFATSQSTFVVTVSGVADAPIVTASNVSGSEDNVIGLSIQVSQGDIDGSENLTIAIQGLEPGAILSDTDGNFYDWDDIPAEALSSLQVQLPLNFSGSLPLTVVVTSTENGTTESAQTDFTLDVASVTDEITTEIEDVSGDEGNLIPLSISVDPSDDESEVVTVSITGVPEDAELVDADGDPIDDLSDVPLEKLDGLSLSVDNDFSGDITLQVTVTNTDGNASAANTTDVTVTVNPVADLPTLTVANGSGSEDTTIPLTLDAALTDTDGSESLSVAVTGLPPGSLLLGADGNLVDPSNIPVEDLGSLSLTPPANFSGNITLSVTATSTDGDSTAIESGSLTISVIGVADAPELDVTDTSGEEGVPLALSISASLTDDSETLSIEITNLPPGATLQDADGNAVDASNVPVDALDGLTLIPELGTTGTFALTVKATSTEGNGDAETVTETLGVTLGEVAAPPVLSVQDATGDEDGDIALTISAAPGQAGDTVTVTIEGLPAGATLTNANEETFQGGQNIVLTPDQLAGLTVHPASDSDVDINLTVTATASDGEATAQDSASLTVTVDAIADVPTLTVSDTAAVEGIPLSLNISSGLQDTDGSETLTVSISGLPGDATLKDANGNEVDASNIPATALAGLTLLPAVGTVGTFSLIVTATAAETNGGDTASIQETVALTIAADALPPVLSVQDATGNEDGDIALAISASPGRTGDTVTVTISGLPAGATLTNSAGDSFDGGSDITLTPDELAGLTVHPKADSDETIELTVTATATDGQDVETNSANVTVTVHAVADAPSLSVSDVTDAFGLAGVDELTGTTGDDTLTGGAGGDTLLGGEGNDTLIGDGDLQSAEVSLDISASLNDADESEALSVTISGIPNGVELLQNGVVLTTGGSFELTGSLDGLSLIVPPGTADFDLTVVATATEDSNENSESVESVISVTLEDGSNLDTDDVLDGGAGNDTIFGGEGDDTISSGEGSDTIDGGEGNDVISVIQESAGGDIIDGGAGTDTLTLTVTDWDLLDDGIVADVLALVEFVESGDAATGSMTFNSLGIEVKNIESVNIVDINGNAIETGDLEGITFTGTSGDDVASGSQFDDTMSGSHGDDTLSGLGGDDTLSGGNQDDTLYGGDGDDTLDGGHDEDLLDGGDGNDTLEGGNQDDVLIGGAGNDDLDGGHDDDTLEGGTGDDTLVGGTGNDDLDGGEDNDTVWGGTGNDTLSGGDGNDTLDGGQGDDTIFGGAGDDSIFGGDGNDEIHVDGGNDVVNADKGDDLTVVTIDSSETDRDVTLDGGEGDDTLRISLPDDHPGLEGVIAELTAANIAAQQDSSTVQTIDSLGITFSNYEEVEIYVGDELVTFGPEIAEQEDVATDTAALETGVLVLTDLDVSDIDGDVLMQATVEITDGYEDGDKLTVDEGLLSDLGLTLETAEATDDGYSLVLSGDASIEDYEAVLASVRFASDSGAPDVGTRTISVTVTDDDGNEADPIDVSVDVGVGEEAELADTSESDQDSAAFISETDEVGATVDSVADLGSSVSETLSVTVGKNGNGNTGEFEVILNGQSLGVFTTDSKATGNDGEFETIEIGEFSLPEGVEASIEVRATEPNSGVLLQGITYGNIAIDAESGDTSTVGGAIEEAMDGFFGGQTFSEIWAGLSDNIANLFSDSYVFLNPNGQSAQYAVTPGEGEGSSAQWTQTDGDAQTTPDTDDLGERYDNVDMGDGEDWVVASAGTENDLDVDLSSDQWDGVEHALGGKGDDTLTGNDEANLLAGGAGNDVLIANGGNDLLVGGAGDDTAEFDIEDFQDAADEDENESFETLDQAISDAYAANDTDGAEALENIRAGFDGGSGNDTLKLTGGDGEGTELSGEDLAAAASNIEVLDVTGVDGPVDMSLSVDDLIEMTDENDELKIMKDGDDTVNIGGQEYGAGEHTFNVDGVDLKVVIEETPPESV